MAWLSTTNLFKTSTQAAKLQRTYSLRPNNFLTPSRREFFQHLLLDWASLQSLTNWSWKMNYYTNTLLTNTLLILRNILILLIWWWATKAKKWLCLFFRSLMPPEIHTNQMELKDSEWDFSRGQIMASLRLHPSQLMKSSTMILKIWRSS